MTIVQLLLVILVRLIAFSSTSEHEPIHNCRRLYVSSLSQLIHENHNSIFDLFNKTKSQVESHDGLKIYHVGPLLGSVNLGVTMSQLNISLRDQNGVQSHCNTITKDMTVDSSYPLYMGEASHFSMSESTKFILTDFNEIVTHLDNLKSYDACENNRCSMPVPFIVDDSNPSLKVKLQANSDNSATTIAVWKLYKEFVKCVIPKEHLLIINSNTMSSPDLYWKEIVQFLGIDVTDVRNALTDVKHNFISQRALSSLIRAGIPTVQNRRDCYIGEYPCMYSRDEDSGIKILVPSVCSIDKNIDQVQITHPKVISCAKEYVNNLTSLFGEKYRRVLSDKLLKPVVMPMYETKAQIILNIGPGSTGTRSLHLAVRMLNVTASHYRMFSKNCECVLGNSQEPVFDGKQLSLDPVRVFWGDTPVIQRWWYYMNYYINQTIFIMTDADEQKWIDVRLRDHCKSKKIDFDNGCFVPIPISYFVYNSFHYDRKSIERIHQLAEAAHLTKVNRDVAIKGFQAFRDLLRCVIPPEKLLWLNMAQTNDSNRFWNQLVNFMHLDIKQNTLSKLIETGVPYMGTKGCIVNKKPCVFVGVQDEQREDGKFSSAIVPSVCVN